MRIGTKIKNLRISKMMTQSELAGDVITRNMLSRIENGSALPSLPTLVYIAGRLKVPAGYLIAEEDNEFIYRKINCMDNISMAYKEGNFSLCRSICLRELGYADDEISLILAECCLGMAKEEISNGRLRAACAMLDEAFGYATGTSYDTAQLIARILVYFRYFSNRLSGTLYSMHDLPTEKHLDMLSFGDSYCRYILAIECIERGDVSFAESILRTYDEGEYYHSCIRAHILTKNEEYTEASKLLYGVLNSDTTVETPLLYEIMCSLEICSRETEDYKGAYEFSSSKIRLLEKMLSENEDF